MLPGGIGTVSEMFAILEENRSGNKTVPILMYDEDGYYEKLMDFIKMSIDKGFTSSEDLSSFHIARNKSEFIDEYYKCLQNINNNLKVKK